MGLVKRLPASNVPKVVEHEPLGDWYDEEDDGKSYENSWDRRNK